MASDFRPEGGSWERRWDRLWGFFPYASLAFSAVVTIVVGRGLDGLPISAAVVLGAAAWVLGLYTMSPRPRPERRARMATYFVGLLAFAAALMARHPLFFVFAITGFLHAPVLRPWPLAVTGVAATSILINTIITGFPWQSADLWILYGSIILIQTVAIGFGTVMGERMAELSEQRRVAVARLEAALEENAGLHAQLLTQAREAGVLDERQRMAREIHDTIAQGLTGIVTQLEAASQATERPVDRQRHIDAAARMARQSLTEARRAVEASQPAQLDGRSLLEALTGVAEAWTDANGVPVEVSSTGAAVPLHAEIELALLRIAQEALANVAKHASATRARLTLSYMGDVVTLDVRDDGVGFVPPDPEAGRAAGFGLSGMRQRASRVSGTLTVESEPGTGTAISARVPAIANPPAGTAI
jgi:signal transduction histidine kinase